MNKNYKSISSASSSEVLDDNNEFLFKVLGEVNRWNDSELELSQSRTNFQIEKFIIHDNFTIPSAFKAAIINRKSVAESLLDKIIDVKTSAREFHFKWEGKDKTQPIWWKTPEGGERLCWYDIDELNLNIMLEESCKFFKSSAEELDFFDKIINRLIELNDGKLVNKKQFDDDQPLYWERRFANQSIDDILSANSKIQAGNIRSMRRASANTVLCDDKNKTNDTISNIKDPIKLLEELQKSVDSGIKEITGMDKNILSSIENDNKKVVKSLFNQELK